MVAREPVTSLQLSVVVPAYNAGATLSRSLGALVASQRPPDQIIVVDDSSTDQTGKIAREFGVHLLSLSGGPHGPAAARNLGVESATGDVLVFVDADVAVHADTLRLIEQRLVENPQWAALFGSYDTEPLVQTWVSRYKNLAHHYVHQHGHVEAGTFWSGCGAIYRDTFLAIGGFDPRFRAIEDIELGARLRRSGHHIRLCRDIQATHLKRWTLVGLLRADIWGRAVPWTRLILRERHLSADLNVDVNSRLSAAVAWLGVLCAVAGLRAHWAWAGVLPAIAVLAALNWDLYRFFARHGGPLFACGAAGLHALYLLYSSLVFALIVGWTGLTGRREDAGPS
jgi:glycosyltransferase involved in cell wall biosynthesis